MNGSPPHDGGWTGCEAQRPNDQKPNERHLVLSFHSDTSLKAEYLSRIAAHAVADEIIKGRYWEGGKGCAVGCTIHGDAHDDYERALGIPQMLAWLEDVIFEGLPNRLAKTWPERFLLSIDPGKDLSRVGWQFLHWLLTESGLGEFDHPLVKEAVTRCADALIPLKDGRPVDRSAAADAATAAWAAAKKAEISAGTSVGAPWSAESAARAAESAVLSATCRASSAERAATAASAAIAGSAGYVTMSDKLLRLLEASSAGGSGSPSEPEPLTGACVQSAGNGRWSQE